MKRNRQPPKPKVPTRSTAASVPTRPILCKQIYPLLTRSNRLVTLLRPTNWRACWPSHASRFSNRRRQDAFLRSASAHAYGLTRRQWRTGYVECKRRIASVIAMPQPLLSSGPPWAARSRNFVRCIPDRINIRLLRTLLCRIEGAASPLRKAPIMENYRVDELRSELTQLLKKQAEVLESRNLGAATDAEVLEYEIRQEIVHEICNQLAHS